MTQRARDNAEAQHINIVAGIFLIISSLACIFWLIPTHVSAETTLGDLPATLVPYLAASVVLILAFGLVLQELLQKTHEGFPVSGRLVLVELFLAAAATALILAINNSFGFLTMSITLTAIGMVFAGGRSWIAIAIVSVGFPVLIWLGAWHVFTVQLP